MPDPVPPVSQRFGLLLLVSKLINPPVIDELEPNKRPAELLAGNEIAPANPLLLPPVSRNIGMVVEAEEDAVRVMFPDPDRFPDKIVIALALLADHVWFPEITISLEMVTLQLTVVFRVVRVPASVRALPPSVTAWDSAVPKVRLPIDKLEMLLFEGWLVIVELNVKFPPLTGVLFGDQFVEAFQVELVVPVQVRFCACEGTKHAAERKTLIAMVRVEACKRLCRAGGKSLRASNRVERIGRVSLKHSTRCAIVKPNFALEKKVDFASRPWRPKLKI